MKFVTRPEWGADPRSLSSFRMRLPAIQTAIHHSVTATLPRNATVAQEVAAMKELERIGMSRFGVFSYSYAVFPSGRVYVGQGLRVGAHTGGANSTTVGVVLVGNYESNRPTLLQLFRAGQIVRRLKRRGKVGHTRKRILPHRAFKATACPGRFTMDRFTFIRRGAFGRWRVRVAKGKRVQVQFFFRRGPARRWLGEMKSRGFTGRIFDTKGA